MSSDVMILLKYLATALILTIIIELAVALILRVRAKYDIIYVVLVNCLTNPTVIVAYILLAKLLAISSNDITNYILVALLEGIVWIVEGLLFKKLLEYKKINPFLLSLILNVASFGLGLVIF